MRAAIKGMTLSFGDVMEKRIIFIAAQNTQGV